MYSITDLKVGKKIELDNAPWEITSYSHHAMGRGGAVVQIIARNMLTGAIVNKSFHGNDKIEPAEVTYTKGQFLYDSGENLVFMNMENYEESHVPRASVDAPDFLSDGMEVNLVLWNDRVIAANMPLHVELKVAETQDDVKGDTQGASTKPATLTGGIVIQVPGFIKVGDNLRVDTREGGKYIERVK